MASPDPALTPSAISNAVTRCRGEIREVLGAGNSSRDPRLTSIRAELAFLQARADRIAALPVNSRVPAEMIKAAAEIARDRAADALDYLDLVRTTIRPDGEFRPAKRAIGDATGIDLRPDPLRARTQDDLIKVLGEYREWAGEPSYRVISARNGGSPSAPTICKVLTGAHWPRLDTVLAIVAGCGGGEEDQQRFASAWRAIRFGTAARRFGEPEPDNSVAAAAGRVVLQRVFGDRAAGLGV